MSRLFDGGMTVERTARFPLVNVLSDADEAVVTAEIPGVDPADLEITQKHPGDRRLNPNHQSHEYE